MPSAHATIGGSSIERTLACPGSIQAQAKLPRGASSAAADRGTLLHEAMTIMHSEGKTPEQLVGHTGFGQVVTRADARTALLPAYEALKKFIPTGVRVRMETRVKFLTNVWGTADVLAYDSTTAYVGDFKFGSHGVEAKDNQQLLFYAGAALTCGKLPKNTERIRYAIIQPRAKPILSQHVITVEGLRAFSRRVLDVVPIALGPNPPLNPGAHCKWCGAKPTCPAIHHRAPQSLSTALLNLTNRI